MTICPYNVLNIHDGVTYCDEGYFSSRENGNGERCGAYIEPIGIGGVCLSGYCDIECEVGGVIYRFKRCEFNCCPYIGCGRHKNIKELPNDAMIKAVAYEKTGGAP